MNSELLLNALGGVDEKFIAEAAPKTEKQKPGFRPVWPKWLAAAACLALVIGATVLFHDRSGPAQIGPAPVTAVEDEEPTPPEELPIISLSPLQVNAGFEGRMCYSPEELDSGNPWREDWDLATPPVYKNGSYDPSGAGIPRGLDEAQMRAGLEQAAADLGLKILSTEVVADGLRLDVDGRTWVEDKETPTRINAVTDKGDLFAFAFSSVSFRPSAATELPKGLRLDSGDPQKMAEATAYLLTVYADFTGLAEPQIVCSGDYSFSGEYWGRCWAYDAAGDRRQDLFNYFFETVGFSGDPEDPGKLDLVSRSDRLATAEKMGDYPLISQVEAVSLLGSGHYQSSVPQVFPGRENIAFTELVYRTGPSEEYLLPYYRFYVALPEMEAEIGQLKEGLHIYGAFYVPAVPEEYIADLSVYDGHFN